MLARLELPVISFVKFLFERIDGFLMGFFANIFHICTMDMGVARLFPRIVDSLASLLESGADREPDIIEQV
jgi:hypothetical protein